MKFQLIFTRGKYLSYDQLLSEGIKMVLVKIKACVLRIYKQYGRRVMWYLCSVVGGPDLNYISKCDAWKEEEEEEILVSYHRDRGRKYFYISNRT